MAPKGTSGKGGRRAQHGMAATLAVVVVVILGLSAAGWELLGGHIFVMQTPSMCPNVCVGSLILDRPLSGPMHVGELVSFHPPGSPLETYTHEVAHVLPGGYIQTRGIANQSDDPWIVSRSEVVGQVMFSLWGVGWLLKALPLLAVGTVSWVLGRPWVTPLSRRTWDRACMTALVLVPLWSLRPLVRGAVIGTTAAKGHRHWVSAQILNTGLLPARFTVQGGHSASHVPAGHLVSLLGPSFHHGLVMVRESMSLPLWGWAVVGVICACPVFGYFWHVVRGDELPSEGPRRSGPATGPPRHLARNMGPRHALRPAA